MNRKVNHWSLAQLNAQDTRGGRRHAPNRPSAISIVHQAGIIRTLLINKMEEYDPDGKKAHEIAAKYRE